VITHESAGGDRAEYLRLASRLLWPPPARVTLTRSRRRPVDVTTELILLPAQARPRLLVPVERRAAAAAVRRYGEPQSPFTRLGTKAIWLAMAGGVGPALFRQRLRIAVPAGSVTIESYLREALGRDVRVSMHLGAARANRKPVLQLLTVGGETVGFAKIGVNALTSQLVRAEHDALTRLAGARLTHLTAPSVLHHGVWNGLDVLVLGALPVWLRRRPLPAATLAAAMAEVAGVAGFTREPLGTTAYWRRLVERLSPARLGADPAPLSRPSPPPSPARLGADSGLSLRSPSPSPAERASTEADRVALLSALETLFDRAGATELGFGSWHGDWTPWNMASTGAGLLVWDWERCAEGVPIGFDALHHWLESEVVPARSEAAGAARACIERAAALLAPFGVDQGEARLTAVLYLAELSARYIADRQAEAGAWLGAPGRWLIPAITGELAR